MQYCIQEVLTQMWQDFVNDCRNTSAYNRQKHVLPTYTAALQHLQSH